MAMISSSLSPTFIICSLYCILLNISRWLIKLNQTKLELAHYEIKIGHELDLPNQTQIQAELKLTIYDI